MYEAALRVPREIPFESKPAGLDLRRACLDKYSTLKSRFPSSHYHQSGYVARRETGKRLRRYGLSEKRIRNHGDAPGRHVHYEKMVQVLPELPALLHRVRLDAHLWPAALFKFARNENYTPPLRRP